MSPAAEIAGVRHPRRFFLEHSRVPFSALPWQSMAVGAQHKVAERGGKRVRLVELTDSFIEPDWCSKAHVGYVLEGAVEVGFEARVERFAQGDGFLIQAGSDDKHKAKALTPRALLLIVEDV
jgi:quercetin dioxygenase-like cupin family protein